MDSKQVTETVVIAPSKGSVEDLPEFNEVNRRRVLRKLDLSILPVLAVMYFCANVDKSNLSNAKTSDEFVDAIGLEGHKYNLMLSIMSIPYILCGPIMAAISKRYSASVVLPICMFIFGAMGCLSAACTNWGGLLVVRMILYAVESGLFSSAAMYLSQFYTRSELAGRLSIFYGSSQFAVAFIGLIAYGTLNIRGSIDGWQIMFLIEGLITVVAAIIAWFVLPRSPARAWMLSEKEREYCVRRIAQDSSIALRTHLDTRSTLMRIFKRPVFWYWLFSYVTLGIPLFSTSLWFPQIVQSLGYDTVRTNLLTVAPGLVSAFYIVAACVVSDLFTKHAFIGARAGVIIFTTLLCVIGYIILACVNPVEQFGVSYFAMFLMSCGFHAQSPIYVVWFSNNTPDENERALLTGIQVSSCNSMTFVASNIFFPDQAPHYSTALWINIAAGVVSMISCGMIEYWMILQNRKANRETGMKLKAGDVPTCELTLSYKDPKFRYLY